MRNTSSWGRSGLLALLAAAGLALPARADGVQGGAPTPSGRIIYGLTLGNHLVSFDAALPETLLSNQVISGLDGDLTLVGMDFRPATGELFALGYDQATTSGRLYKLNVSTAAATPVASAFTINLGAESAANVGFDFNPTVDRIRVVSADINANFRLNPLTGGIAATDTNLAYAPADAFFGRNPQVGACAYINSYLGATSTILYDIDLIPHNPTPTETLVILSTQSPPNNGTLNTVNTGTQPNNLQDLDVDVYTDLPTGLQTAYISTIYQPVPGLFSNLFATVDLATATATPIGFIGPGNPFTTDAVVDLAAFIDRTNPPVTGTIAWALQQGVASPAFVTFDTDNPTYIRSLRPITGVTESQIAGFDTRPLTGELFAMGYEPGTESARLYIVAPGTGVATAVGAGPVTLPGAGAGPLGFDFNPTVDRIRVVTTTGHNFRLNPNTGAIAATDSDLGYAPGDLRFGTSTNIGTAAYTNSFAGASSTLLYTIDEQLAQLNTQNPPNNGTQNTVGSLGLSLNASDLSVDLDILTPPVGSPTTAFLTANPSGSTSDNLYTVNLTTGAASLVGRIGGGIPIRDLALRLPVAKFWAGTEDTNWSNGNNWNPVGAPIGTDNIVIPSGPANQPTLSGSGAANLVLINAGATVTVGAAGVLTLNNNLTNNGTFAGNATSQTLLNKPTAQVIGGTGSTTFGNLTVSNAAGASLEAGAASAQVLRILTLNGNLTTNGRPLTLLSDASGTAMVVNSGGAVVGAATVQRYITPGTVPGIGYRHMSAPVSNTTINDLAAPGFVPKVNGAYNAIPTPALPASQFPNVLGYDEQRGGATPDFVIGYFSPGALTDPMIHGRGYTVYMNGTVKPDFVGTLGNGDVSVNGLTRTGNFMGNGEKSGWHLLGNPYPAPIDWDLVTIPAGMSPSVSVYRTAGKSNGTYSQRVNGVGPVGVDLIAMGQAFFARVTGAGPVDFTFHNTDRLTTYANPAHFRQTPDTRPTLHLTLSRAGQPAEATDEAFIYFQDGATPAVDGTFDAEKMRAEGEAPSIFTLARGAELAINGLPADQVGAVTVPLGVVLPVSGTYTLSVAGLRNFAPGTPVVLLDRETGTEYDLTSTPDVKFSVGGCHSSQGQGTSMARFSVRFGHGSSKSAALSATGLDVFPNPVSTTRGLVDVSLNGLLGETATAVLYDVLGRPVSQITLPVADQHAAGSLDVRHLTRGTYTLRVQDGSAPALTRQVVID